MILKICLRNWHNEDYFITCKKMIVDTDNLAPVELPVYIDKTASIKLDEKQIKRRTESYLEM